MQQRASCNHHIPCFQTGTLQPASTTSESDAAHHAWVSQPNCNSYMPRFLHLYLFLSPPPWNPILLHTLPLQPQSPRKKTIMSRQDRGRQQTLRSRFLSWARPASSAPQRGPSQRQPSGVTTTAAQPQEPTAQEQPSPQLVPAVSPSRAQVWAPSRRRPSQPPPSSPEKPQMGAAPSRPAPRTQEAAAPPSPPRPQPARRIPSRQLSRTLTQPPSPPGPPSQPRAPTARGTSPSPPPPTPSPPAQPAESSPEEPKAPSTIPSPAPPTPPAASRPPSPTAKAPSSLSQPAVPTPEITEPPSLSSIPAKPPGSPATKTPQLQPSPSDQEGRIKELETVTAPTQLQPQEASQEKDQAPIDSAFVPIQVEIRAAPEAGHIAKSNETPTTPYPSETQLDKTQDQLPPKQTDDIAEPPMPETEPEEIEEEKPVITPEAGQEIETKLGKTEEKKPAVQTEPYEESDPNRLKTTVTKPEELKEVTPKTSPVPTPKTILHTQQTPDGEPQIRDTEETTNVVETKQTGEEPPLKPTQVLSDATQPISEVEVSEAGEPEKPTPPPPPSEKQPAPPSSAKGKEGKIAISAIARTSTTSRDQSGSLHKEIKEGISRLVQSLAVQHPKRTGGGHGISIITLAGDNQGASMYVGYGTTSREGNSVHIHKGPSPNGGEAAQKKAEDRTSSMPAASANVNSNVQAINNSILHDSYCTEENPGVHLVFSTTPPEFSHLKKTAKPPQQLNKPKQSRTPLPQKLASEPNVRRRCLRALFLESSDDDPENPQRPRRHGCRYNGDERKKAMGEQDAAGKPAKA